MADGRQISIRIHTHRCEMLDVDVNENLTIMNLKTRAEGLVGEGQLFRITGRPGNPSGDTEFKLIFHGQVLDDYDSNAFPNLSRLQELKRKFEKKTEQREAAEEALNIQKSEPRESEAAYERQREREKQMEKQLKSLKKEEDDLRKTVNHLEANTQPKKIKDYYIGNSAMIIITPARARLGIFGIRVNYLGHTMQVRHSKCECVGSLIHGLRCEYSDRLPKDSDDFKIQHALFWRCAPTKMLRLDPSKCLCEYGFIEDNTIFEHELEKIPVSSQARSQLGGIRRKSKLSLPRQGRSPAAARARRSKSMASLAQSMENSTLDNMTEDLPPPPPSPHEVHRPRRSWQRAGSRVDVSSSVGTRASSPDNTQDDSSTESEEEVSMESSEALVGSAGRALRPSSGSSQGSHRSRLSRPGSTPASMRSPPSYGPSKHLFDAAPIMNNLVRPQEAEQDCSSLVSMLKDQEKRARREEREAKKACKAAKRAMREAEQQRRAAEGQAARAQAMARAAETEIEQAHRARRFAEKQIRERAHIRTERLLQEAAQNASTHLPPIEMKPECVVCLDGPAEVMAYPCGHRCYCISCADLARQEFAARQVARGDKKCTRCPVCRESLEDLVRVF